MKHCNKCKLTKATEEFRKDKSASDGLSHYCKECCKEYYNTRYQERYSASSKARSAKRRKIGVSYINEIKKSSECQRCGEKEPICLDFHHVDPLTKDLPVSSMANFPVEKIQQEIDKCIVLCANCHRKEHARMELDAGVGFEPTTFCL